MSLYLYALVDEALRGAELGRGLGRRPVTVVRVAGVGVAVEEAPAPAPSAAALRGHDRVVRRIARLAPATLPTRFATTVADRRALAAALAPRADAIERALDRVRGAVQLDLRVSGERARVRLPRGLGPGARWLAARAARARVPEIEPVTEATRPFVRAVAVERHEDGERLASVYHLVARADLRAWRAAFRRGAAALERVRVAVTGPWPCYAFAELD